MQMSMVPMEITHVILAEAAAAKEYERAKENYERVLKVKEALKEALAALTTGEFVDIL